jgi:hypothetical protein
MRIPRSNQSEKKPDWIRRLRPLALAWLVLTGAAALLQWSAGAYDAGFGNHPDEGAHFVTGLMVRDYLAGGIPQNPLRFAETYYDHYPKVALGHYPPAFYAVEGLWLLVFPVGRASAMALMAVLSGALGAMVFSMAERAKFPRPAAALAALVAVTLPLTQSLASMVMSDLLLALFMVAAALAFARYLERGKWTDSLLFGLLAAAAGMTKGSGLLLALVPPLAILLGGRFRLLLRGSLWLAPLPVLLVCGPWFWFSSKITAEGMSDRGMVEHLASALPYFGHEFLRVFGFTLIVPAVLGTVRILADAETRRDPRWGVILALPVALVAFYSLVPAGLEARYLLPVVPSVLLLAAAGIRRVLERVGGTNRRPVAVGAAVAITALFALETFTLPRAGPAGFREAVRHLLEQAPDRPLKMLVSSDARGEGAFISEVAIQDRARPCHTVARGSKVLATSDWLGRGYEETFADDDALRAHLTAEGYDAILADEAVPERYREPHHGRLARVLREGAGHRPFEKSPSPGPADGGAWTLYTGGRR